MAALTDDQRAAVRLRAESLLARNRAVQLERAEVVARAVGEMAEHARAFFDSLGDAIPKTGEAMRPLFDSLGRVGMGEDSSPADPSERALTARRNRNTGPQQRRRAPRAIGRPSAAGHR